MPKPKKRRSSRAKHGALPKGVYRVPTGGYVTKTVSSIVGSGHSQRREAIVALRRDEPEVQLLAKAFLELARQKIEDERQQQDLR